MSDARLRKIHRDYMQGLVTAKDFLAILRRHGAAPAWDWMAGNVDFYELPLRQQVEIFLERWPTGLALWGEHDIGESTAKLNNRVVWLNAGPDAPDVQEVLAENLGTFSYQFGLGKSPVEWATFEDYIAMEVTECHRLLAILRHYKVF